jgi:hypothetical protein
MCASGRRADAGLNSWPLVANKTQTPYTNAVGAAFICADMSRTHHDMHMRAHAEIRSAQARPRGGTGMRLHRLCSDDTALRRLSYRLISFVESGLSV